MNKAKFTKIGVTQQKPSETLHGSSFPSIAQIKILFLLNENFRP